MVELIVVIGIIAVLVAILMPALSKARQQARYTKWRAMSNQIRLDPNLCVYYNLQNDAGSSTLTNMATIGGNDQRLQLDLLNATLEDSITGTLQSANYQQNLASVWSMSGRWPGKPCLTGSPGGVTPGTTYCYPAIGGPGQAGLARELFVNNNSSISICMWLDTLGTGTANTEMFQWGDTSGNNMLRINFSPTGNITWSVAPFGNGRYCSCAYASQSNKLSDWDFWVFTYNQYSHSMWIFKNGTNLTPSGSGAIGSGIWPPLQGFNVTPRPTSNDGFSLCLYQAYWPNQNNAFYGRMDEFAIFASDLSYINGAGKSPNGYPYDDVTGNGANIVNEWYDAGQP